MYRNAFQGKFVTVFYSCGSNPLGIWETHTKDGYISRFIDPELKSMVLEIGGTNISTTYMVCPKGKAVLGITMPFLIMIVKNMKKYFSFEVTILDETGTRRRFRVSNFQSSTSIQPLSTAMPIGLSEGWNQILFNLSEFTQRAYKKSFVEVQKIKINANIRLRRIYFSASLIPEDELPPEYKLYFPVSTKRPKVKKPDDLGKENVAPQKSLAIEPPVETDVPVEEKNEIETIKSPSKASIHSVNKVPSGIKPGSKTEVVKESKVEEVEKVPETEPVVQSTDGEEVVQSEVPDDEKTSEVTPEVTAEGETVLEPTAEGATEPEGTVQLQSEEEIPVESTEPPPEVAPDQ